MVDWKLPQSQLVATRRELLAAGFTPRQLTEAVRDRVLIRVRKGHYAQPGTDRAILEAVRVGGKVACVSAASLQGLWVPDAVGTHVWLRREASRLRSPRSRFRAFDPMTADGCELHWVPLARKGAATAHSVGLLDALIQVARCLPEELAATVFDSALNGKRIRREDLDVIFAALPQRCQGLRDRLDGRAMSGIETLVRLIVDSLGLAHDLQVEMHGVGLVDLVVEGCVVIEVDGRRWHEGLEPQSRDYDRDAELVARGYIVLRFNYRQVMFHPDLVRRCILGAIDTHRLTALS